MINKQIKELLNELRWKTDSGKVNWIKTSLPSEFKLSLTRGFITVSVNDINNLETHQVDFFNSDGELEFSFEVDQSSNIEDIQHVKGLYSSIIRSFEFGTPFILELLNEIRTDGKIGKIK